MSARRSALLGLALCLAPSLPGCAWANRENRRVWNAFEEHVVPEDGAWFVVSRPISVPLGFVAILVDVFVVHPAMIVDDALGDASDLWRDLEWEEHYYTEAAALPLRTAASPVWFAFAFLGRSTFDIRAYEPPLTAAEERARAAERDARNTEAWIAWFDALAAGSYEPMTEVPLPTWTEQLEAAFHGASRRATALGRAELYTTARHVPLPPWKASPWMGLDDPDPVVRHLVLVSLRAGTEVPDALRRALLEDPSETIRLLASRRWP